MGGLDRFQSLEVDPLESNQGADCSVAAKFLRRRRLPFNVDNFCLRLIDPLLDAAGRCVLPLYIDKCIVAGHVRRRVAGNLSGFDAGARCRDIDHRDHGIPCPPPRPQLSFAGLAEISSFSGITRRRFLIARNDTYQNRKAVAGGLAGPLPALRLVCTATVKSSGVAHRFPS